MKKYIRFIAIALTVLITCSFLSACNKKENDENKFTDIINGYQIVMSDEGGSYIIQKYTGSDKVIEIPAQYNGLPVSVIGADSFCNLTGITSVTIPSSIVSIEARAFDGCTALETIELPATVCEIGSCAFQGTPWFNALTDEFVIVGDGVFIKYNGTNTSVTLPDNVKFIVDSFRGSANIQKVTLNQSLEVIGEYAFAGTKITSINIPGGVRKIGARAFQRSALETIDIPNGVTEIGKRAFYLCKSLTTATIPESVKKIGDEVFYCCGDNLTSIVILTPDAAYEGYCAFDICPNLQIQCPADSTTQTYLQNLPTGMMPINFTTFGNA